MTRSFVSLFSFSSQAYRWTLTELVRSTLVAILCFNHFNSNSTDKNKHSPFPFASTFTSTRRHCSVKPRSVNSAHRTSNQRLVVGMNMLNEFDVQWVESFRLKHLVERFIVESLKFLMKIVHFIYYWIKDMFVNNFQHRNLLVIKTMS